MEPPVPLAIGPYRAVAPAFRDAALLAAVQAGDEAAFVQLVDEHGPVVMRVAQLLAAPGGSACDLAEATWARALDELDGFDGSRSLRAWLVGLLIETCPTDGIGGVPLGVPSHGSPDRPGDWVEPPRRWRESRVAAIGCEQLRGWMRELPRRERLVLSLRDVERWPASEVEMLLGIDPDEQRAALDRARRAMRIHIDPIAA